MSYDKDEISEWAFISDKIKFNKINLKSEKIRDIQLHIVENERYCKNGIEIVKMRDGR